MKERKLVIFLISVIATGIVVFNNFTDLMNKLFKPFDLVYFIALALMISGVGIYLYVNRKG